jgi:hypothetical protein
MFRLDPPRLFRIQLRDQVEHHLLQNLGIPGKMFAVDGH